jgi:hypothetical protein
MCLDMSTPPLSVRGAGPNDAVPAAVLPAGALVVRLTRVRALAALADAGRADA